MIGPNGQRRRGGPPSPPRGRHKAILRQVLFQLHWFLGITAGCVLVVISVTGVTMSFEDEIMAALGSGIMTVAPPPDAKPLSPDALLQRIAAQQPGRTISTLAVGTRPQDSARVVFARGTPRDDDDRRSYVDPYTGALLGPTRGEPFFRTVRELHRWLLIRGHATGWGRQITGVAAFSLLYFALSGLWLRWPRRPLDWRQWLVIDTRLVGRALLRTIHVVVGSWLLLFYLFSGLTGLWWSYDWYKNGVTRLLAGPAEVASAPQPGGRRRQEAAGTLPGAEGPRPDRLATALAGIVATSAAPYRQILFTLPRGAGPLRARALPRDARHDQAYDDFTLASDDGHILKRDLYADRPLGRAITGAWLSFHRGAFLGLAGRILILTSTATLPLFAVTGWLLYLQRRRLKLLRRTAPRGTPNCDQRPHEQDRREQHGERHHTPEQITGLP